MNNRGGHRASGRGRGGPPSSRGVPPRPRRDLSAQLPSRFSDSSHRSLINSFKALPVTANMPLRPGYGTRGATLTLRSNFFAVRLPKGPIFTYTVDISPEIHLRADKARVFQLLERNSIFQPHLPYIAHNKKSHLVSARQLPQPFDIQIQNFTRYDGAPPTARVYTISIRFIDELGSEGLASYVNGDIERRSDNILPLIASLNVVLRHHIQQNAVESRRRPFAFPLSANALDFSSMPGLYIKQGFHVSVKPSFKQLLVNINVCMKAFFRPGNLAQRLLDFEQHFVGNTRPRMLLRGVIVRVLHLNRQKKVKLIGTNTARNTFFESPQFVGRVSVENYFNTRYNITLNHAHDVPLVDVGFGQRQVWIPAELCVIEDGHFDRSGSDMGNIARPRPRSVGEAITTTGLPALGFSPRSQPLEGFDINVDTKALVLPGRELSPPSLRYRGGTVTPTNGAWNTIGVKFRVGGAAKAWWVLVLKEEWAASRVPPWAIQSNEDPKLKDLVESFSAKMRNSGITIPDGPPRLLCLCLPKAEDNYGRFGALAMIRDCLKSALQQTDEAKAPRPDFILVLLEKWDNFIYPGIKRIGDVELGIITIHMQLHKARGLDHYLSNMALKLNTKLGGTNHVLDDTSMEGLRKESTIMVGVDLRHPGPGCRPGSSSVAAMVASVDGDFVIFPASLRTQSGGTEIDDLSGMLIERLQLYERKNNALPNRIIIYRGVVPHPDLILYDELPRLSEAFAKLSAAQAPGSKPYRPSISIIMFSKRKPLAKFWPTDSEHVDRSGNTRPGTVVDKGVTSVFDFDFYLQTHAGDQGFVKSTHYTVLYDENSLTADEIQQGTNDLSYLYVRATRAIASVPVLYYAGLASRRGRCYLNESSSVVSDWESLNEVSPPASDWGGGPHDNIKERMFYI